MHSISVDKGPVRPKLSIDTDLKKKRWSKSIFSSKGATKDTSSSLEGATYLHQRTDSSTTRSSQNSSSESLHTLTEKVKTAQGIKTHGVQSVLKKLHRPHFHIRPCLYHQSKTEYNTFVPVVPEPVKPSLINWSPETPLSPPPWELQRETIESNLHRRLEKHSLKTYNTDLSLSPISDVYEEFDSVTTQSSAASEDYHSDSEIHSILTATERIKLNDSEQLFTPDESIDHESDVTLVGSTLSAGGSSTAGVIRRRSSCPNYGLLSPSDSHSGSTLVENDIISITEQHTRHMSILKKYTHPADKKPALKSCQKAKARAAKAAANGTSITPSNSFYSSFCEDIKYLYIPNVFDLITRELIMEFSAIKPRKYQLHRKISWKREAKALMTWHHLLEDSLQKPIIPEAHHPMSPDKQEKNELTRKFIMREFFDTEVNFWNQLYYSKVIFYDAIVSSISKGNPFTKEADADVFANLFDLMQFSAKLINRLRHFQIEHVQRIDYPIPQEDMLDNISCNNLRLGKVLREMSLDLIVFLRCALDYKENKKSVDINNNKKAYLMYKQKLNARKETSQFTMYDFLIIPIQRVARYGLLIADLIKHSDPTHSDYKDLVVSYKIVTSLTAAMNSAQKKNKA